MRKKTRYPERIEYSARTEWDGKTGAVAYTSGDREIVLDTPKTYGGLGEGICPDELFVSSLLGCLNNTFLDFQRRFELELISLELRGEATAQFDSDGYRIIRVDIEGTVIVDDGAYDIGLRCVELMKEYCHISRTIQKCLPIIYQIAVKEKHA